MRKKPETKDLGFRGNTYWAAGDRYHVLCSFRTSERYLGPQTAAGVIQCLK